MQALLERMGDAVSRAPRRVLVVLVVVTLVLGGFAAQQSTTTDLTAFAPDSDIARAFERVQDDFGAGGAQVQVIVDTGRGGDVLSGEGLRAATSVAEAVRDVPSVRLAPGERAVRSFADPVLAVLEAGGSEPSTVTDEAISSAAAVALTSELGSQLTLLFSGDLSVQEGTARAGLVLVELDPSLSEAEAAEGQLAVAERIEALDVEGVSVDAFSEIILRHQLEGEAQAEMPRLLGLSLLLIVAIVLFQYRSVSDVLLALAGLIATIVWMFGVGVLLDPDFVGLVGSFTQVSTAVPVLLVGLGVDYAIHPDLPATGRNRTAVSRRAGPPRWRSVPWAVPSSWPP